MSYTYQSLVVKLNIAYDGEILSYQRVLRFAPAFETGKSGIAVREASRLRSPIQGARFVEPKAPASERMRHAHISTLGHSSRDLPLDKVKHMFETVV